MPSAHSVHASVKAYCSSFFLRFGPVQRQLLQRTDRVKGVELHPTEPWSVHKLLCVFWLRTSLELPQCKRACAAFIITLVLLRAQAPGQPVQWQRTNLQLH